MARNNDNLHSAKTAKNDELTPTQKAKRKYNEKHRISDEVFLKELRENTDGWAPIKGYDEYEINIKGEIYLKGGYHNGRRRKSKFIKKVLGGNGYYVINLNREKHLLHRLLAETFIPNPDNKPCIDHIDGNPKNNSLDNLRWVTHKENLNNPVTKAKESKSHKGLPSNIIGRKKVWIDKNKKKYKMV